MKRYEWAAVVFSAYGIAFQCTDSHCIDAMTEAIKKFVPNARFKQVNPYGGGTGIDPESGQPFGRLFQYLDGKDLDIGYWLVKQLCHRGWEPYDSAPDENHYPRFHFRRMVEDP
jgi:hypothetical protein